MRKILTAIAALAIVLSAAGCDGAPTAQQKEQSDQAADQASLDASQKLPYFTYSQIKQNMIELEKAEADGIQTTTFMFGAANQPDPIQVCPSIGVPIPSTASLSNPQQVVRGWYSNDSAVVGQEDPNGVYMPTAGSGTFVMCVQGDGSVVPVYAEGNVHTVFGPARWDSTTHSVAMTGPASFHFTAARGK